MTESAALQLTILNDFEHIDDTLDDSAWWDRYMVKAGAYDVVVSGSEASISVEATLVEEFRTTRLMNRNKAEAKSVYEETVFVFRPSAQETVAGPLSLAGTYGWIAAGGSPAPTTDSIAEVVTALREATNARRAVGSATAFSGPDYAAALEAEAAERATIVTRAQAGATRRS